jgi:hypothetical protein
MPDEGERDAVSKHAELIGRVALLWSDIHRQLGELFEAFTKSQDERTRYWTTPSDRLQRQLILSAASIALKEFPDLQETLELTLRKIDALAGDRNAAIHTFWAATPPPERKVRPRAYIPKHKALRDDFEAQFKELLTALSELWLTLFDLQIDYFDRKPSKDQN